MKIISILRKIVRLIVRDLILRKLAPKLQESRWNLFSFSKHGNREKTSVFWKKRLERSRRLISGERGRRLITQVWLAYFDLFWLPVRFFYNDFKKNLYLASLKDPFEVFWSFSYEVTSVGELWTDKYLSYNFDSNLKLKKRNHWRGSFFEFWFYRFWASHKRICPKRTPSTSAG